VARLVTSVVVAAFLAGVALVVTRDWPSTGRPHRRRWRGPWGLGLRAGGGHAGRAQGAGSP